VENYCVLNSAADNIYSNLRNKAGKVVEVVGLLLGFIVVAVVEIPFENYVCVSDYLKNGFTLALYFQPDQVIFHRIKKNIKRPYFLEIPKLTWSCRTI
jgi:hypothetical protein